MKKVYCYSKSEFDNLCINSGWNDRNLPKDKAFISICSTEDVKAAILREPEPHYFQINSDQVLNLEFDDIAAPYEFLDESGFRIAEGISLPKALKIARFIDSNIATKDFIIHCRAGQSRSQAVVSYIMWLYGRKYNIETRFDNPPITPNQFVLEMLKKASKILHLDLRLILEEDGYVVRGITDTTVNNVITTIRVYLKDLPNLLYYVEEGVWCWEDGDTLYSYDDWDFRTKFNEFAKNYIRP